MYLLGFSADIFFSSLVSYAFCLFVFVLIVVVVVVVVSLKYIFWYAFDYTGGWVIRKFSLGRFPETRLLFWSRDCQNNPPFKKPVYFSVTITGDFERFQYLTFKKVFWTNKLYLKDLECTLLLESVKIYKNRKGEYKSDLSQKHSFATIYFNFGKFDFHVRTTSLNNLVWQLPKFQYSYFF